MILKYDSFAFTPILGWSSSRYELFDKCRRQYYYNYYGRFSAGIPSYKISRLKDLTSVPLEIGNVVHDVMEAFLRRLQQSDNNINESRFYDYAGSKTDDYFRHRTFMEIYYGRLGEIDMQEVHAKINACITNFLNSPTYNWIFMKALGNRTNWMIEPQGYGETRLDGMKAYCKMDFLFPVDDHVYILDWKTGKKDPYKHTNQLVGYAAAASSNFGIPWDTIFPKIVYLYPEFEEFEIQLKEQDITGLFDRVREQTEEMCALCVDKQQNIPRPVEDFPMTPSPSLCKYCRFQEICFPETKKAGATRADRSDSATFD